MSRMRLALLATAVGLSSAVAVIAATAPGTAEASLIVKYRCVGGVAGDLGVEVEAAMTPKVSAGPTLAVNWALTYNGTRRFGSPGYFAPGSLLNLEGTVDITGAWDGQLRPKGGTEQKALEPGTFLDAPSGLSDSGSVVRSGKIRLKPTGLAVKFTPAAGEVMVNNHKPTIDYTGSWWRENTEEEFADHLNDLHKTTTKDAVAKFTFTGTQVAYIGRRERGLSPVRVLLDGQPITDPLVEPGKDSSGVEMVGTKTKEVLWESPVLEYKQHTIEVINTDDKPAYVDAFRVKTGQITTPPVHNQAICTPIGEVNSIEIDVAGSSPSPTSTATSPSPTPSDTDDPDPDPDPDPDDSPSSPGQQQPNINAPDHVIVPYGGRQSTTTGSPTAVPTTTKYVKAQVRKVPKGGVASGEAPVPSREPYFLMAGGALLLVGSSTAGGLMMRRRRAAQAKEVSA